MKIGFLGLGRMGSAIAAGLVRLYADLKIRAFDLNPPDAEDFPEISRIDLLASPRELEESADIVLLAVKPQDMKSAVAELHGDRRYISIAAGLQCATVRSHFTKPLQAPLARVMPNICALVGKSVTGIFCEDLELARLTEELFNAVGYTMRVDKEEQLHAITALSGSGPAYVFSFLQSLADGGVLCGIPYEQALELAVHTLAGSAEMVQQTGDHPSVLRNRVTSPGGTTIAGLRVLEGDSFHTRIMEAIEAAWRRSRELGG